jgi:sugar lactone lactonase YvrE
VVVALGGCAGSDPGGSRDATAQDAAVDGASGGDGGGAVERGPVVLPLDADPNGLWWDAPSATLYIADDNGNRVLRWRDGVGTELFAMLPPGPANGPGLGQLVKTPDGTLVVTRFGDGTAGDVVYVSAGGTVGRVSSLDATRRRIGLTVTADGTLYDGWFFRGTTGRVGTVSRLDLAGTETDLLQGLGKPVGVLAVGTTLYVSDQDRNEILTTDLGAGAGATPQHFATATGPDLLCEGPSGSLFSGSLSGVVYRVAADGTATTFDTGYSSTRGVAYDAANRRLFVAEHDTNPADGTQHALHIVPVDP